jgi:colanic acid/amylovoran biosynthesis glycosyltransferase
VRPDRESDAATVRVAYVVSAYPAVSHAFIQREVLALRARAERVDVFSVRRADPSVVMSRADAAEHASTTSILPISAAALVLAHGRALLRSASAYFATLRYAMLQSPPGARSRLWQLFYFAEAMVLWAHCRRRRITHLHAHFANVGADVAWLASHFGRLVEPHAGWCWTFTMHGCIEFWSVDRFNLVRKVEAAEQVLCISEYTRAQLMALCAPEHWDKLTVVHCGVDVERYRPPADRPVRTGPVEILAVGRLSHEKGQPIILEALEQLRASAYDAHLTLVGDGPFRRRLEQQALELGVASAVTFAGAVGQDAMPKYYRDADIFCQPSFAEGIPVVLMEAMASALPVVSSGVAGIPELVDHGRTGLLVPPGRPDLLAGALAELIGSPELRLKMGTAGRATVEAGFDIERIADQIDRLFRRLRGSEFME